MGALSSFAFSTLLHNNGFVLPCHPGISFDDIDNICSMLLCNIPIHF